MLVAAYFHDGSCGKRLCRQDELPLIEAAIRIFRRESKLVRS